MMCREERMIRWCFFFNDTATTEIYTLSLHDALPILEPILKQSSVKEVGELNRETIDTYIDWDKTIIYKLERGEGECAI